MIHVFFNIDESYIDKCKTVIKSILANTKEKVTFHVVGASFKCNFATVKCYEKPDISMLTCTVQMAHITMTSTYRIFAPFIFNKLDKIIYLDSDLIVLDDIKKLWDRDVKYIAGVQDGLSIHGAKKNNLNHTYINTGVMVMNLKNLRKIDDYMDRIKATQNGNYNLSLLDQDIINIAFEKEIELLPFEWNVLSKIYSETTEGMLEARKKPSIIHWAGFQKPWKEDVWQADKWHKYGSNLKKAIVLTYADITKADAKLLKETDVYKIACNTYCADLKPDIRLCSDDIVEKCLNCDTCPVISTNYDLNKDRVINGNYLPKRHTTLVSCIDYLMLQGYTHILLVATNPAGTATYKLNLKYTDSLKDCLYLYKYTKEGTFNVPVMTIKEFLSMEKLTDEEKILGYTEPPKKLLNETLFTDACLYEVETIGYNNKSTETGELILNILNYEQRQRLLNGELEIEYNGLRVKRITKFEPEKEEQVEEVIEEPEIIEEAPKPKPKKTATKKKASKR